MRGPTQNDQKRQFYKESLIRNDRVLKSRTNRISCGEKPALATLKNEIQETNVTPLRDFCNSRERSFATPGRDCSEQSANSRERSFNAVQTWPPDADPTRGGAAKAWQIIVRMDVYIFVNVG